MLATQDFDYIYYTTLGCHLCDQGIAMLNATYNDKMPLIGMCDIASDDELINLYGTFIPVLESVQTGEVIKWPFTSEQLADFFKQKAGEL